VQISAPEALQQQKQKWCRAQGAATRHRLHTLQPLPPRLMLCCNSRARSPAARLQPRRKTQWGARQEPLPKRYSRRYVGAAQRRGLIVQLLTCAPQQTRACAPYIPLRAHARSPVAPTGTASAHSRQVAAGGPARASSRLPKRPGGTAPEAGQRAAPLYDLSPSKQNKCARPQAPARRPR